jgi:hypothetical protein
MRSQDVLVKPRDPGCGAARHVELHVGDRKLGFSELGRGRVATVAIAPRARCLDQAVAFPPGETRLGEQRRHLPQPGLECRQVGHHDADVAAQHLGTARRQVKLAAAHVHPHVVDAGHEIRVAREAQAAQVEEGGQALIGNADVHVLEPNDIAQVLARAVVACCHVVSPRRYLRPPPSA